MFDRIKFALTLALWLVVAALPYAAAIRAL